jgi:replicative DNA helicase
LAKELNLPVLVLCQLNRDSVKTGRPPQLSDLRESGAIEQDADVVLMLHPKQEDGSSSQVAAPTMQCFVHKNRNGSVGDCLLSFFPSITRFENYTQ